MLISISLVIIGVHPRGPPQRIRDEIFLQAFLAVASRLSQVCQKTVRTHWIICTNVTNGRDTKCLQVSPDLPGEENWPSGDHTMNSDNHPPVN